MKIYCILSFFCEGSAECELFSNEEKARQRFEQLKAEYRFHEGFKEVDDNNFSFDDGCYYCDSYISLETKNVED